MFKVKLVAKDLDLFYAWKKYFGDIKGVEVIDGNILDQKADAIVSPANSFGYMDGGLDLKYSLHFGWELEEKLRSVLEKEHFGEIPVGLALLIDTGNENAPYLISAPTMRVPSNVSETANAYLAFKAVLQNVLLHNKSSESKIESVLCPGLGTGEGKLSAELCAKQMFRAYEVCILNGMLREGGLAGAVEDHLELLGKR